MARHGRVRDAASGRQARYQESTDTGATDLAAGPATSLVFEQQPCLRRKEDGTGGEKRLKTRFNALRAVNLEFDPLADPPTMPSAWSLPGSSQLGHAVLSVAARSPRPTGIHAQARRAAARLAHEVSSISCASLDPPDLNSPMTERSTW